MSKLTPQEVTEGVTLRPSRPESVLCGLSQTRRSGTSSRIPLPSLALHPPFPYPGASYSPKLGGPGRLGVFRLTSQSRLPRETCRPRQGRAEPCCTGGPAAPPPPRWPSMEALVCAFSELRIREGAGLQGGVAGGEMPSGPHLGPKPPERPQGHACLGEGNGQWSRLCDPTVGLDPLCNFYTDTGMLFLG